jgi:hypothetical protein
MLLKRAASPERGVFCYPHRRPRSRLQHKVEMLGWLDAQPQVGARLGHLEIQEERDD